MIPTEKQTTLMTRKTMGKKQVELSSQSDTDELPSLDYVPLYRSPPTMPGTPVASTSKATKRPFTQKQKTSTARKDIKPKKGADNGDGESSQSDSDYLPSPLHVSIFHTQSEPPLKKKPMSGAEKMKKT